MEEEQEFVEELESGSVGFSNKQGFDKPSLVATAVHNCLLKRAVEMREGYKTSILDKFGNVFVKIIPDTRKEFCGSVDGLTSLLRSEIKKHIKKEFEEVRKKKEALFEKYAYREKTFSWVNGKLTLVFVPNGRVWLPEKTDKLPFIIEKQKVRTGSATLTAHEQVYIEGVWDYQINRYWDEMLELYDNWFAELNDLITAKLENYKKQIGFEEKKK